MLALCRAIPKPSRLIQTIHSKDLEDVMPPPEAKMTLTEKEKAILAQWIKEGAKYEKHWAFTELAESIAGANIHLTRPRIPRSITSLLETLKRT